MVWLKIIFLVLFSFNLNAQTLSDEELIFFEFIDFNNDNLISFEEIENSLKIVFKIIDLNQDNYISTNEIDELKNIYNLMK